MPRKRSSKAAPVAVPYEGLVGDIAEMLAAARRASARAVNALMTATYWEIGRRIVEFEQGGAERAEYGEELLKRLANDLTVMFGRGYSRQNLQRFRLFYVAFQPEKICSTLSSKLADSLRATPSLEFGGSANTQTPPAETSKDISETLSRIFQTPSEKSGGPQKRQTPSAKSGLETLRALSRAFPLSWSHYVQLVSRARSPEALEFYHTEALRGGWSVRQLQRQIDSQFYERTALSKNKAKLLAGSGKAEPGDILTADEEVKDPLVLEFLGLKDEYSESDLEEALILHLEHFLLELGNDFAFIARQRRLRIDDEWFRIDLLFFHRRLKCLVVIDLKLGRFTHADAGQMHLYLNYAGEHWTQQDENPPVGLILCAEKGECLSATPPTTCRTRWSCANT